MIGSSNCSPCQMLYSSEPYEKVRRLLKSFCVARSSLSPVTYSISTYKSRSTVCSIRMGEREIYVIGDEVFELSCSDFCVGAPKEKQIKIQLTRFSTRNSSEEHKETEGVDIAWAEKNYIEFGVGAVDVDGKKIGTMFIFDDSHGLSTIGSVLKKFIQIECSQETKEDFERSLIRILRLSNIL